MMIDVVHQNGTRRRGQNWLVAGLASLVGIIVPFLGYGALLAAHSQEDAPRWLYAAIPSAFAGPEIPSTAQFLTLAVMNVLLWFSIAYLIGKCVLWMYARARQRSIQD
jgi:hypothetical protein